MRLISLQEKFRNYLLGGRVSPMARHMKGRDGQGAERLRIYLNNSRISLTEALADNFPVLCRLVGQQFFQQMAGAYIPDHPPETPVLAEYGSHLPDLIRTRPELADYEYLADVAELELAWNRALHSRDGRPLQPDELGQVDLSSPDDLFFTFLPSLQFIHSRYPLFRIWEANQDDSRSVDDIDLDDGPDYLILFRPEWRINVIRVTPGVYDFIGRLHGGASLGEAAAESLQVDEGFQLSEALALIFCEGLAAQISMGRDLQ